MFKDLKEIEDKSLIPLIGLLLLFTPGFITIFIFNRGLFLELDIIKLLLLSLSYGFGMIVLPASVILLIILTEEEIDKRKGNKNRWEKVILASILFSSFVFYFAFLISLLPSLFLKLDFKNHFILLVGTILIAFLFGVLVLIRNARIIR